MQDLSDFSTYVLRAEIDRREKRDQLRTLPDETVLLSLIAKAVGQHRSDPLPDLDSPEVRAEVLRRMAHAEIKAN